ncbi:hypothetical protein VNI00_015297 [Paramarasmius palmivorus]|uniref:Protein kinase domain-containing protein n=1 Tax=Paramarasmius palmivorus TaxID=297713 RepID=A0AAW0BLK7_9AGAR
MTIQITFELDDTKARNRLHRARTALRYPSPIAQFNRRYPVPDSASIIRVTDILSDTKRSTVYLAHITDKHGKRQVVLKVGDVLNSLGTEADCYNDMKHLQGSVVPHFYGLFRAERNTGGYLAGIVLEQFGEPVREMFDDLERSIKARILDHLFKIHKAGILPFDFEERNVLIDGNELRVIDFEDIGAHKCSATYDFLNAGEELEYHEMYTICHDILKIALEMGFWISPTVRINDFDYKAKNLPTDQAIIKALTPQQLIDKYSRRQSITLVKVYYQKVYEELQAGRTVPELEGEMERLMKEAEEAWKISFPRAYAAGAQNIDTVDQDG